MRNANRPGGRRGILLVAAAGLAAVLGAAAIGVGLFARADGPTRLPAAESSRPASPESGEGTGSGGASTAAPDGEADAVRPLRRSAPTGIAIPAIDVDTETTVPLGVQPSGEIEVPEEDWAVGWYDGGPTPGQFGPALMGAHVDSAEGPAVFYRLAELRPGDEVQVRRDDGTTAVFTVDAVDQYPKSEFPTRKVYAPTGNRAELRLVTCGGTFNEGDGHYRDNIVVYAEMTDVRR